MSDASVLRAAAAVVEVRALVHPHLRAVANRLLAIAADLDAETPDPPEEDHP
ncbi:hypothetical protein [Ornithinimicrobium cerasi]|uniref:hypothetical protein n=1 Tax=Ornithinimicrobium cerasi TaxID=2248773 RepID=UPI00137ADB4D|nr:hypothetical protein [Ornithinimicrobium cerasi]